MTNMQERIKRAFQLAADAGLEGPELVEFINRHAARAIEQELLDKAQTILDEEPLDQRVDPRTIEELNK